MVTPFDNTNSRDKRDPLTEDQLIGILRKEENGARNWQWSSLSKLRWDALNYYDRQPYGDEEEGSSSVITSEFQDTIEGLMPSMMRIFAGNESSVEFSPSGPGQEQWAKEASQYVPHVFMVRNEGFRILSWLIKDALMYRLGGVTVDVEDFEETKEFPVTGLPQDAIDILIAQSQEQGAEVEMDLTPDPPAPLMSPEAGGIAQDNADPLGAGNNNLALAPTPTFSGTITITKKSKRVTADNIAPEDILFTPTARDQDKASFLGFRKKVTASELVEMGLSLEDADDLRSDRDITVEDAQRNESAIVNTQERNQVGDSERPLWVVVSYVRADFDGIGTSEMHRVVYAHAGGQVGRIIENIEWEGPASIALATPILMSHVIVGRCIFDQVQEMQDVGTALTRGLLDNQYQANRPRAVVSDQVNLDTFLDWVPGAPVRLKQGAKPTDGHVAWLQVPDISGPALQALEHFRTVREDRTGVVRQQQGLDADTLNKTASGLNMLMGAAQQRPELIARTLAETGIKRLYRLVYRAIKRAASGPTQFWTGQTFASVDPTKWPDDMELTVNVGAGTRDQAMQGLATAANAQEKLITMQGGAHGPYVTPENVANLSQRVQETLGYRSPGLFFQPPEKVMAAVAQQAGQPPPLDPKVQAEQMRAQADMAATKAKSVADTLKMQQQMAFQAQKDNAHKEHLQIQLQIELARGAHQHQQNAFTAHTDQADRTHDLVMTGLGALEQGAEHAHDLKMAAAKPKPTNGSAA